MAILSCHVSIKLPPKISDGQEDFITERRKLIKARFDYLLSVPATGHAQGSSTVTGVGSFTITAPPPSATP